MSYISATATGATGNAADKPRPAKVWSAIFLMLALPPFAYYLWICVTCHGGALFIPVSAFEWRSLLSQVPPPTAASVFLFCGWFLFQAVLQIAAPGKTAEGSPLADGTSLKYKLNGWFSVCSTLAVLMVIGGLGWVSPAILYDQLGPLLTTANIFAFALSLFLLVRGKRAQNREADSGNALQDYFLGVQRHPRIGDFDLKFFCESRPGLIGWAVIDLSLAAKQYELHGSVTTPMVLVLAFQLLYIADCFWHEEALLTTWDIKHERFGWMLCWGNLVWVPFTYTLQAQYLVSHTHELPLWASAGLVVLNLSGYCIFRGANLQKHRFRKNPDAPVWGKKAATIKTDQHTSLLISGWWGMARHANYLGDLLMALAWCLPCLFRQPLPYFYFVYMLALLVHRERRDHVHCSAKYGAAWAKYCQAVRWRIVPGLY